MTLRSAALSAALLLAACGGNDSGSSADASARPGGTLPPAPPADAAPDTRFPLPYPQAPVPAYGVGQDVEIMAGNGVWEAAKVVEVADVDGNQVVRTSWPGGTSNLPYLISNLKNDIRPPTGRIGHDLLIGRYTCYDGGTDRSDLDFRVAEYGKYTDPYGENAGTFTTSGDTITFSGGKLDGQTGQRMASSQFYFTPQFTCRWKAEGL